MLWGGVKGQVGAALLTSALLCLVVSVDTPAARAAEQSAASMYQPGTVDVIELTMPQKSIEKLEKEPEVEYVEGTFSLATTNGTPTGIGEFSTPIKVGIRLKGSNGSFRPLSEKAAFKIKFSFVKGQKFLGLKKMTLNNMVQDRSMIHETLAYEAFRSVGVEGSHTGYAYVRLNGMDYGLYLNIETLDQEFLEQRFGPFAPPQHLYSGEYGTDVTVGGASKFEVTEGEEENRSDLEALIAAVNDEEAPDWSTAVEPVADLKEMTLDWAVEKYSGQFDGYSGMQASYEPNNYYLYSNATGVFQMLPWGLDQTWEDPLTFEGKAGLMFDKCLEDESCAAMYRASLREVQSSITGLGLDSLAERTAALLEPWEEMDPRKPYSQKEIGEEVARARAFMAKRPSELNAWFATQPPEISLALQPGSILANGASTSTATATVTDANGNPAPGQSISFSSTDEGEKFGPLSEPSEGTYTAQVTASKTAGTATITATDTSVNPSVVGSAALVQTPGPATHLALALQPGSILANGAATSMATATVTDANGNPATGQSISFSSTDEGEKFGPLSEPSEGTYTAQVTASKTAGTATITATDTSVNPSVVGSATLVQTPGPATHLALALQPGSILANGAATSTATATVTDANGNPATGQSISFSSTDEGEKFGPVNEPTVGTYTAQVTASKTAGTATITATDTSVNPSVVGSATLMEVSPGVPTPLAKTPPIVSITEKPSEKTRERRPSFSFVSSEPDATFQCRLGDREFQPCRSPHALSKLSLGGHVFGVRAINQAGEVGSAVSYRFLVNSSRQVQGRARRRAPGEFLDRFIGVISG